mmetsp:Transcript_17511/g.31813  ORF Transcript_17511/g.31813 Transcript_17511/m.31813 type:complete len:102 (-) Transcript_17511:37-342(-)
MKDKSDKNDGDRRHGVNIFMRLEDEIDPSPQSIQSKHSPTFDSDMSDSVGAMSLKDKSNMDTQNMKSKHSPSDRDMSHSLHCHLCRKKIMVRWHSHLVEHQ